MTHINCKRIVPISDLTHDDLVTVYRNLDDDISRKIFDDAYDMAMSICMDEFIPCWDSGIDYCIGWDRGEYFRITDRRSFLRGLDRAQNTYCMLPIKYDPLIAEAHDLIDADAEWDDDLCDRCDEVFSILEDACHEFLMQHFRDCFDDGFMAHWMVQFFDCCGIEAYVDDDFRLSIKTKEEIA